MVYRKYRKAKKINSKPGMKTFLVGLNWLKEKGISKGDKVIVTDRRYRLHFGNVYYCIGFSEHGFILLSRRKSGVAAKIYLGKTQCEKYE